MVTGSAQVVRILPVADTAWCTRISQGTTGGKTTYYTNDMFDIEAVRYTLRLNHNSKKLRKAYEEYLYRFGLSKKQIKEGLK